MGEATLRPGDHLNLNLNVEPGGGSIVCPAL
jgi:hypothetical protein